MLRCALYSYLRTNAQACDSADGIARWWMPPGLDVTEPEISSLLDELLDLGLITRFSTLDGKWLYRRSRVDANGDRELERRMAIDSSGSD
jgi:DNA-binding transcriptional ArsR family regulator